MGELAQVGAEVEGEVAVIGQWLVLGRVLDEGVHEDVGLGVPPAVDGLFGDPGPGRDALHRDAA